MIPLVKALSVVNKAEADASDFPFFLQMYRYTGKKDMLFYPWDFPGKNTDVVCRFLLQGIFDPGIEPLSPAYPA